MADQNDHGHHMSPSVKACDVSAGLSPRGGPILSREFFVHNLQVRGFIIEMIWWTGLAPWEFDFLVLGSLSSTLLDSVFSSFEPASHLFDGSGDVRDDVGLQGYLAPEKTPTPLGPP